MILESLHIFCSSFFFKISINIYILFCHSLIYLFTFFFFFIYYLNVLWLPFLQRDSLLPAGGVGGGRGEAGRGEAAKVWTPPGVELLEELVDFHVGQCGFWNAACLQLRVFILGLDQSHFAWFLVPNNLYLLPTGWLFLLRKRSEQQMGVRLVCLRWPD